MNLIRFTSIVLFVCCSFLKGFTQDTLTLLNGNQFFVNIKEVNDYFIDYTDPIDKKIRLRSRELSTVFSYRKKEQSEVIIYQYNPEIGNIYQVEEMRHFMTGERHADQYYTPLVSNIISLLAGGYAGYAIAESEELAFIATPLLISSIVMIPGTRVKRNDYNQQLRTASPYRNGYKRVAKGKKFLGAFKLSIVGMTASILFVEAID
jgi:hypothetical protein